MCKVLGFNPACTLRNQTLYYLSIVPVASCTALIVGKYKCRSVSRMTWREQLLLSLSLVNKHFFSTPPSFSPFSWFFFSSNFSSFHPKHRKFFFLLLNWKRPKRNNSHEKQNVLRHLWTLHFVEINIKWWSFHPVTRPQPLRCKQIARWLYLSRM